MSADWPPVNFDEYFDMQHAGNWVAQSPPPIASNFASTSILHQQGDVMAGEHVNDILICGLSPISPGSFAEHDLARWTRVDLVVNLPWFQLVDLIGTLLNALRRYNRPSMANSDIGKIRLNRFLGSTDPSVQPAVRDLGRPLPHQRRKAESQLPPQTTKERMFHMLRTLHQER